MLIGSYILIITLNAYGTNASTKRYRLAEEIEKHGLSICFPQETHHRYKDERRYFVQI